MTDDKHVIDDKHLVFDVNTVEEALDLASRQWGVPAEELRSEVIGSEKVFLGLFGKKLKVEVTLSERVVLQVITIKPFLCHQFVEGGSRYWLSRSTPILEFWNLF